MFYYQETKMYLIKYFLTLVWLAKSISNAIYLKTKSYVINITSLKLSLCNIGIKFIWKYETHSLC